MKTYYGSINKASIIETTLEVIKVLGGGSQAYELVIGTMCAETLLGSYRSPVRYNYGLGLTQFDKIAFEDVKTRTSGKRKKLILDSFNIDVNQLEYRDLANSPLISILFCRLFYLLKPGAIPNTLKGQAEYWKKYYNTKLGAGTVEGYIKKYNQCMQNQRLSLRW